MSKLVLPAIISPPRLRKDRSASISFDTRELTSTEIITIMGYQGTEGWLTFSANEETIPEPPKETAEVDEKTPSERLKNVLYAYFKQETEHGRYVGLFETFRREKMEVIIEQVKKKLE